MRISLSRAALFSFLLAGALPSLPADDDAVVAPVTSLGQNQHLPITKVNISHANLQPSKQALDTGEEESLDENTTNALKSDIHSSDVPLLDTVTSSSAAASNDSESSTTRTVPASSQENTITASEVVHDDSLSSIPPLSPTDLLDLSHDDDDVIIEENSGDNLNVYSTKTAPGPVPMEDPDDIDTRIETHFESETASTNGERIQQQRKDSLLPETMSNSRAAKGAAIRIDTDGNKIEHSSTNDVPDEDKRTSMGMNVDVDATESSILGEDGGSQTEKSSTQTGSFHYPDKTNLTKETSSTSATNKIENKEHAGSKSKQHHDEEEEEEEEKPRKPILVDYANKSTGALILDKSPTFKGTGNLLVSDNDKYAIAPCKDKKYVVIGLSEDILVKSIKIANYERYSSQTRNFQISGSQTYLMGGEWVDMGTYTASPGNGEQTFDLLKPSWARYLKFRFISYYGAEHYCTVSQIKVHGSTTLQGFHEQWASEMINDDNNDDAVEDKTGVTENDEKGNVKVVTEAEETTAGPQDMNELAERCKSSKDTIKLDKAHSSASIEKGAALEPKVAAGVGRSSDEEVEKAPVDQTSGRGIVEPKAARGDALESEEKPPNDRSGDNDRAMSDKKVVGSSDILASKAPCGDPNASEGKKKITVLSNTNDDNSSKQSEEQQRYNSAGGTVSVIAADSPDASSCHIHDGSAPETLSIKTLSAKMAHLDNDTDVEKETKVGSASVASLTPNAAHLDIKTTVSNVVQDAIKTVKEASTVGDAMKEIHRIIKTKIASNSLENNTGVAGNDGGLGDDANVSVVNAAEKLPTALSRLPGAMDNVENFINSSSAKPAIDLAAAVVDTVPQNSLADIDSKESANDSPHTKGNKSSVHSHFSAPANSEETSYRASANDGIDKSREGSDLSRTSIGEEAKEPGKVLPPVKSNGTKPNFNPVALLPKLSRRFPSALCLDVLDFQDFKTKAAEKRAGAKGAGASGGPGSLPPGAKNEPIFKRLTDEIKALQISQSVHDQYLKAATLCYHQVIVDLAIEIQLLEGKHEERLATMEANILYLNEQSQTFWFSIVQSLMAKIPGVTLFIASVLSQWCSVLQTWWDILYHWLLNWMNCAHQWLLDVLADEHTQRLFSQIAEFQREALAFAAGSLLCLVAIAILRILKGAKKSGNNRCLKKQTDPKVPSSFVKEEKCSTARRKRRRIPKKASSQQRQRKNIIGIASTSFGDSSGSEFLENRQLHVVPFD